MSGIVKIAISHLCIALTLLDLPEANLQLSKQHYDSSSNQTIDLTQETKMNAKQLLLAITLCATQAAVAVAATPDHSPANNARHANMSDKAKGGNGEARTPRHTPENNAYKHAQNNGKPLPAKPQKPQKPQRPAKAQ